MGQGQSRLKYQQAVGVLLAHPSLSPNDIAFWSQFWTLPSTPDEVFEGISPSDIRNIKQQNPGNLAILLHKAIGQLTAWIQRTTTTPDGKATHEFISALNCIRLITRILPFLFEDTSDGFAEMVFWHNKLPFPVVTSPRPTQSQPGSPFIGTLPTHSPSSQRAHPPVSSTPTSITNAPITFSTEVAALTSPQSTTAQPTTPQSTTAPIPFGGSSSASIPEPEQTTTSQSTTAPSSEQPVVLQPSNEAQIAQSQESVPETLPTPTTSESGEPVDGATQPTDTQSNENASTAVENTSSQNPESPETRETQGSQGKQDAEQNIPVVNGENEKLHDETQEPKNPEGTEEPNALRQGGEIPPPSPSPASIPLPSSPAPASIPLPGSPAPASIPLPGSPAPASIPLPGSPTPASIPLPASPKSTNPFEEEAAPAPSTALPPPPPVFEWQDSTLGGGDQPLAARLLDTLMQLLFLPHFTVSSAPPSIHQIQAYQQSEDGARTHEQMPFYYYWAVGVGTDTVIPTPATSVGGTTIWANRSETLKCLLACFSQTLYVAPEQARLFRNRWLEHVVCKHGYFTKALFSSLINVVCTYDPIGWGVPYNHLMFRDDHEGVASVALQVLNVLLQYNQHYFHLQVQQQQHKQYLQHQQQLIQQQIQAQQNDLQLSRQLSQTSLNGQTPEHADQPPSDSRQQLTDSGTHSTQHHHAQQLLAHSLQLQRAQQQLLQAQQPQQSEQQQNLVLNALQDMRRNKDFQLIVDTFVRLMANPIVATAARLPYSVKQLEWHHHVLMLFWHLLDINKKFLTFVIASDKCPQMLVPMMCFMIENRKDASSLGVIQLCTFILLLLSGERDFAVSLNKPIVGVRLPADLPRPTVPYTHFDLLVIVAQRVILDGISTSAHAGNAQHLAPVRECLLTALANASPFVKGIGVYAAMTLVKMFHTLSDPRVLFSSENVCRLVHLLLEIFNNVIQYQFEGNPCLIYAILRSQNEFSKLAHLKIVQPPAPSTPTQQPPAPQFPQTPQTPQPPQNPSPPQTPQNPQNPQTPQASQNSQNPQTSQNPQATTNPQNPETATLQQSQTLQPQEHLPPPFIPTGEWLEAWKRTLPLDIILKMITMVSPKIQSVCAGSYADEQQVLIKLQNTTLVGLLPAPHPILIRKYQSNDATQTWLLSYMWGSIFLQQSHPPLFFGTRVKLFVLHTT